MMDKELAMQIAKKSCDEPVYVFDKLKFITNFIKLRETFRRYYPNFNIGYSYKTNYTNDICNTVNMLGGYAEVVSPFEVIHALKCNSERIIYNGVCKDTISSKAVLAKNGKYNCDSMRDVLMAEKYAIIKGKCQIGLRVNFDIGNGKISRFGFDVEGKEFKEAVEYIKKSDYLELKGLHCHFSKGRDLECWKNIVEGMIKLAK